MSNDAQQIAAIRSQTLAVLAELTAHPKPTYVIDGQTVAWNDYLLRLRETVDWCDRQLAREEPFEVRSQGIT
jgi:hypothetical protein